MKLLDGYKKLITTLTGMMSVNYVAFLVSIDDLDAVHKIELYALIVATLGALAGVHGLFQSKLDRFKTMVSEDKK